MKSQLNIEVRTQKLTKRIAKNIKILRIETGLTQSDMVSLGYNSRWYQRLESGNHIPTIITLEKLAFTFKVEISDLLK
jgi:transcriptional regulator with XRE-family HTH domain